MRPRPRLKVLTSLATFGLLLGLMLGRLWYGDEQPAKLLGVQADEHGVTLRFNHEANVRAGHVEGALALLIEAQGEPGAGQSRLNGLPLRWTLEAHDSSLLLTLLSTRPLQGQWDSEEKDGQWWLRIQPRSP
ncbi:MAG: hypothetical protein GAK45_01205 [Pseudomonas citronellolis]|nr:MAG: hypothetical protein GAK45_01205 [Pseudomonas citronellolis]